MKKNLSDFTGVFQVSETLTFELRPQGKTEENLKKSGLLEQDFERAEDYPEVKKFLDEQHKKFLQKVLSGINDIDWHILAAKIAAFQQDKDLKSDLEKVQAVYRKNIADKFIKDDYYTLLVKKATPSKFFAMLMKDPSRASDELKTFARFACYFKGFQENRRNIYSKEAQQISAAYRAVNENFTKFLSAVNIFSSFSKHYPDLIDDINSRVAPLLDGKNVADLLRIEEYNQFLPQSGIDFINTVIGEINYAINQYRQQHKEIKTANLPFMPMLFKQILSDREQAFAIKAFESDTDLCLALKKFVNEVRNTEINGKQTELFSALQQELKVLNSESDLFVDSKGLEKISVKTTGYWDTIAAAMSAFAVQNHKNLKAAEKYCNQAVFHLKEINSWNIHTQSSEGKNAAVDITTFWNGEYSALLFAAEKKLFPAFEEIINQEHDNLRADKEKVRIIKEYLDTVQDIFHLLKPLAVSAEYGGDLNLLGVLTAYYTRLEQIIPLYNQTRNYILKKPTDVGKIKLMFNNPVFASGWSDPQANSCAIFKNGQDFYLGILSDKHRTCLSSLPSQDNTKEDLWQKMELQQMAGPVKDLPNLLQIEGKTVRKTGRKDEQSDENKILEELKNRYLPAEINRIRKSGSYSTSNENFSRADLDAYIDFYKERITEYKSDAHFHFRKTSQYSNWLSFTQDINAQAYQINFSDISKKYIWKLVDEGKLYLFQIWNKDFSPKATGTPNKFTLYWKEIFTQENLADIVFKLNGEAELFLRRRAIEPKITHAVGEKMVNKTIVTDIDENDRAVRQPLPPAVHNEVYLWVNGKITENDLSEETRQYLKMYPLENWETGMPIGNAKNRLVVKKVAFDIIKDKRFTEDKYSFHVPVTINFKAPAQPFRFNEKVLEYLTENPDVKIIGLDRGERNLIYLTLIDQQGRILKQKSLNRINGVNYHGKLDQREKERDSARKSWLEIGQIKDLKAGYLSGVIYEIVKMMVEENAIVVMEDLNFGFKRGRMKIEKQIYQKFEKALIEKLNYLVFKDQKDHKAPGGVLAGYQLAGKFESFAKLGKQCGFIFYVPAGFTSKIDPATGFVNLFDTKECTNVENVKAFFDKFTTIRYSAEKDSFAFEFDYQNFKVHWKDHQNKWTVYSTKEAWSHEKDKASGKFTAVFHDPTSEIKGALDQAGVKVKDGFDLLALLRTLPASRSTASLFQAIFYAFKLSVSLRHSNREIDKIISPVMDSNGEFFNSGSGVPVFMPQDADANGAFHIALKGLYLLRHGIKDGKLGKITHDNWMKFVQTRHK